MNSEVLLYFQQKDPKIYEYAARLKEPIVLAKVKPEDYFYKLSREIAYQQLNIKAAATIWGRFENLFLNNKPTPEKVLEISIEEIRKCGLSNAKANYLKNIAEAFSNDENYNNLDILSDEEVIELLTKIKGVGRWTAEMFLMFSLGREDIFSFGDYGLKKGMMKVYKMKKEPTKQQMERISKKWRPYRTYASMTLWKAINMEDVVGGE